jgi:hypothetical protein
MRERLHHLPEHLSEHALRGAYARIAERTDCDKCRRGLREGGSLCSEHREQLNIAIGAVYRVIRPLQTADLAVRIYVVHTAIQSLMTPAEFDAFRAFLEPTPQDEPGSPGQSVPRSGRD